MAGAAQGGSHYLGNEERIQLRGVQAAVSRLLSKLTHEATEFLSSTVPASSTDTLHGAAEGL
jgi:hypothetical protein